MVVFDRIAVVPFEQIVPEDLHSGAVRCPLCGAIFSAAKAVGRPETVVEARFLEQLQQSKPKFSIIAGERVAGIYRRVSAASLKTPLRQVLRDPTARSAAWEQIWQGQNAQGHPLLRKPS